MKPFFNYLILTFLKFFNISNVNKIKLEGYTIHFGSIKHLKLLYKEIFVKENYQCEIGDSPYIIDGGANIGLAVLYFKKKFPNARIVAFEPNAESFSYLKRNVEENKLSDVEIYKAALSDHDGTLSFYTSEHMLVADIGASAVKHHVEYHYSKKGGIDEEIVDCKALSTFIDQKVDLLKMDIEGSEGAVFKDIKDKFQLVENSIMEYHYQYENSENHLSDILNVIESNNHVYFLGAVGKTEEIKTVNNYIIKSRKSN